MRAASRSSIGAPSDRPRISLRTSRSLRSWKESKLPVWAGRMRIFPRRGAVQDRMSRRPNARIVRTEGGGDDAEASTRFAGPSTSSGDCSSSTSSIGSSMPSNGSLRSTAPAGDALRWPSSSSATKGSRRPSFDSSAATAPWDRPIRIAAWLPERADRTLLRVILTLGLVARRVGRRSDASASRRCSVASSSRQPGGLFEAAGGFATPDPRRRAKSLG